MISKNKNQPKSVLSRLCSFYDILAFNCILILALGVYLVRIEYYWTETCDTDINKEKYGFVKYDRNTPIIWIGGFLRSGTTLVRSILDAHPEIQCGPETHVIPKVLSLNHVTREKEQMMKFMESAGVTKDLLDESFGAYVLSIMTNNKMQPIKRICNKDPMITTLANEIVEIFPNSKFVIIVRDGRAVTQSCMSIPNIKFQFKDTSYEKLLKIWNDNMSKQVEFCNTKWKRNCHVILYEKLVQNSEEEIRSLFRFLDAPWDDALLNYHELVGKEDGTHVSRFVPSHDQVNKPIYTSTLYDWMEKFPNETLAKAGEVAPLLHTLGYRPDEYPNYDNLK